MHNTIKWKVKPIAILLGTMFTLSVYAEEVNSVDNINDKAESTQNENDASCITCNISGSVTAGYSTNIYNKDDYRAARSFSWDGTLKYTLSENTKAYISSGGYRALDDEVGTYATDSVIGLSHSKLYEFGESGKIGVSGQFTIPTSEASRNDKLQTAFRIAIPVSFEHWGVSFNISPRLRKNFHRYETYGGKSLTEWTYSLFTGASYSWEQLTLGVDALGGNTISYQGTRRDSVDYGGSIYGAYDFNDNWSFTLTAATSGAYADAERGTLGNIDLFDADKASYTADITFSF